MANTDTQQNKDEVEAEEVDYAFLVIKRKDGPVTVQPLNEESGARQPELFEVHTACSTVIRNLETQEVAVAVAHALKDVLTPQKKGKKGQLVIPK